MACKFMRVFIPEHILALTPANSIKHSFEVPSNIILKMVRPSLWISVLLFCWGVVMTLMGIIKTYEGLLVTRFFLGVAEAGFFPAST